MTDTSSQTPKLARDLYEQSRHDLFALKSKLPEPSVAGLAREVLRRIEARGLRSKSAIDAPTTEDIDRLCYALISDDEQEGPDFIENLRTEGASLEVVYLSYLAAAARKLGHWWDTDDASFAEVTLGTSRIFGIMRGLSHVLTPENPMEHRTAVFASVPGETHTFGVRMAADLFRKSGWDIDLKIGLHHNELIHDIEALQPKVIGLSCAGEHAVDAMARLVIALRISCPGAAILLSGQVVQEARDVLDVMGADAVITDVPQAQGIMASLWDDANSNTD